VAVGLDHHRTARPAVRPYPGPAVELLRPHQARRNPARFSVDLAAFEGSMQTLANGAVLPAMELVAGLILMFFLNWQLALVALLILPDHADRPRISPRWR